MGAFLVVVAPTVCQRVGVGGRGSADTTWMDLSKPLIQRAESPQTGDLQRSNSAAPAPRGQRGYLKPRFRERFCSHKHTAAVSLCLQCVDRYLCSLTSESGRVCVAVSHCTSVSVCQFACVYLHVTLPVCVCVCVCAYPCCWWNCTTSADSRCTAGWAPRTAGSSTTENKQQQSIQVHNNRQGLASGWRPDTEGPYAFTEDKGRRSSESEKKNNSGIFCLSKKMKKKKKIKQVISRKY